MALATEAGKTGLSYKTMHVASVFKIVRSVDLIAFRFTDYPGRLWYADEYYDPIDGVKTSAIQLRSGFSPATLQISGAVGSIVTTADLFKGIFRQATVTHSLVDYRSTWSGPIEVNVLRVKEITFDKVEWRFELESTKSQFNVIAGGVYGRTCRYRLGDGGCKVTPLVTENLRSVSSLPGDTRSQFTCNVTQNANNFYSFGYVYWVTGNNAGLQMEIWTHTAPTSIQLREKTPFPIQVGDTFNIRVGCDKTLATCTSKFNNSINFGGFPTIPAVDKVVKGPLVAGGALGKKT